MHVASIRKKIYFSSRGWKCDNYRFCDFFFSTVCECASLFTCQSSYFFPSIAYFLFLFFYIIEKTFFKKNVRAKDENKLGSNICATFSTNLCSCCSHDANYCCKKKIERRISFCWWQFVEVLRFFFVLFCYYKMRLKGFHYKREIFDVKFVILMERKVLIDIVVMSFKWNF